MNRSRIGTLFGVFACVVSFSAFAAASDGMKVDCPRVYSAKKIADWKVIAPSIQAEGKIVDWIAELGGSIEYAVVTLDGNPTFEGKRFLLPLDFFALRPYESAIVLTIPEESLKKAPALEGTKWPSFDDFAFWRKTDEHYGKPVNPSQGEEAEADAREAAKNQTVKLSRYRVGEIFSASVKTAAFEGETLGKIEDVLIDAEKGSIVFAVVGTGGLLGIGEKSAPIPWKSLQMEKMGAFLFPVTKDTLKLAPHIEKSTLMDDRWVAKVTAHYRKAS